jgi:hypothetical protein
MKVLEDEDETKHSDPTGHTRKESDDSKETPEEGLEVEA